MTKHDNGGPAFPDPARASGHCMDTGMTLRDWFAGQALAGFAGTTFSDGGDFLSDAGPKSAAFWAYSFADAMIAARGKCYD